MRRGTRVVLSVIPPLVLGNSQPRLKSKLLRRPSGGYAGPVERRRVVDAVVGRGDEVQVAAVGGEGRRRRRKERGRRRLDDGAAAAGRRGPVDVPAVHAALDRHPGPLVQSTAAGGARSSWRLIVRVQGVQRRDGPAPMKVVAGPLEQRRRTGCCRASADVSVAVLGTRYQAAVASWTETAGGSVQMPRTPTRGRLVRCGPVRTAGRHRQHRGPVREVARTSQSRNFTSVQQTNPTCTSI